MLNEIYIENLAVIEKADVLLGNKLNVFTGETGAGKSILINGINAVLGQRITKDIVRTGANKAVISAVFTEIPDSAVRILNDNGFETEDSQVIITREISSDGGSTARINSRPVSVSLLKEIGEKLINIHGQHDNQELLASDNHIRILDEYAETENLLTDYINSFHELQDTAKKINRLIAEQHSITDKIERLSEFISEVDSVDFYENEDSEVEEEYTMLKSASVLDSALRTASLMIEGDDETESVSDRISAASLELASQSEISSDISKLCERLESASIEINDISSEISRLMSKVNMDPQHFEKIRNRREELYKLKRKYGELSEIRKKYDDSVSELEALTNFDSEIERLTEIKKELLAVTSKKASELSKYREKAAKRFENEVGNELKYLDMPNVKLEVRITKGKLTHSGMDNIEFLISANIGETPKPIAKIASGGELSRIMLALKSVLADKDNIPTLIFDEIDTGVSGRAAQKIGRKLRQISRNRQVLCVTHLAQIAVMGDDHHLIEKSTVSQRTVTNVKHLNFEQRKYEIARILGGDNITPLLLENAEEQLKSAMKE